MTVETATIPTTAPADAPASTPAETQTAPRLSEALRYGQMNVGQATGAYVDSDGNMCALGTIWHGMGYDVAWNVGAEEFVKKNPEWGFLMERINTRPLLKGVCGKDGDCRSGMNNLAAVVIHLNDTHKMPRNQIADHLSGFGL
jgi:hypothetical protein